MEAIHEKNKVNRIIGILPDEFIREHVKDSGIHGEEKCNKEKHNQNKNKEFDFFKWVVLKPDSRFLKIWKVISTIAHVLSPYYYACLAMFGHVPSDKGQMIATAIFEIIFVIGIFIHFITEYLPEGENIPERDL
jgi:hypothetical protein